MTAFVSLMPWLVLALPVGVLVDRADRRLLMVVANVVRVGLFGVIATTAGTDSITLLALVSVLVGVGTCEVVFDSSSQAFLPMLVDARDLPRANGYLFAAEVVTGSIVGLSIGAFLYDQAHALPFAVNAASFALAAILIASIKLDRTALPSDVGDIADFGDVRATVASAMRSLWDDPLLRLLAIMLTVTNFGLMFGFGIFVKYADVELGVTGSGYGLLLAATALGAASAFGALVGGQLAYATNLRVPYFAAGVITLGALAAFAGPLLRGTRGIDLAPQARDRTPAPPSIT